MRHSRLGLLEPLARRARRHITRAIPPLGLHHNRAVVALQVLLAGATVDTDAAHLLRLLPATVDQAALTVLEATARRSVSLKEHLLDRLPTIAAVHVQVPSALLPTSTTGTASGTADTPAATASLTALRTMPTMLDPPAVVVRRAPTATTRSTTEPAARLLNPEATLATNLPTPVPVQRAQAPTPLPRLQSPSAHAPS
jgi:hypothetical protein